MDARDEGRGIITLHQRESSVGTELGDVEQRHDAVRRDDASHGKVLNLGLDEAFDLCRRRFDHSSQRNRRLLYESVV